MSKKIIALNGSGRKNGNSAAMLDAFIEGVTSVNQNIEIERIDLFDLDYKGCRGCHGCELKTRKQIGCIQKDGATELLKHMREADGIVFSTPIFFWELSAQLRALLERYIYPGSLSHHQEIMAIYTMYQPKHVSDINFTAHANTIKHMADAFLHDVTWNEIIINQTQTWDPSYADRYIGYDPEATTKFDIMHQQRWPNDVKKGKDAGAAFAKRL